MPDMISFALENAFKNSSSKPGITFNMATSSIINCLIHFIAMGFKPIAMFYSLVPPSGGQGVTLLLPGFLASNYVQFYLPATFRCRVILLVRYSVFRGNQACCLNQLIFVIQRQ